MCKKLSALFIVAGLLASNTSFAQDANRSDTFLTAPFLQRLNTDGITILWELSKQAACEVEFGIDTNYGQTQKPTVNVGKKDRTGAGGTGMCICVR